MVLVLNGPIWFRGIDTLFTLIFALITLLIMLLSNKAYRLTSEPKYKYFSLAFGSLFLGFSTLSLFTALLITHISTTLTNLIQQFDFVYLVHIFFVLLAYMALLIITLKITDKRVITLLISLTTLFILFSYQHYLKFHLVSLLLLVFLTQQFYRNYQEKKNQNAKLVLVSFYLLFTAEVFAIINLYIDGLLYIPGQIIQLLGYLFLFYMFIQVLHHGRKKRKA